jgi:pimeloyl-ACP methyl ester carboxylesterase
MPCLSDVSHSAEPVDNGYFLHRLARPDGGVMVVYANRERLDAGPARPALVVITGSGCGSVFPRPAGATGSERLPGHLLQATEGRFTIVVLEKRGVAPFAPGCGGAAEDCSEEYHRHATRAARWDEQQLLLRTLIGCPIVEGGQVTLIGFSEGATVAAAVAAQAPELVGRLVLLSGGGPSQMFELALLARTRGRDRPSEVVEDEVTGLMRQFRDMLAPDADPRRMFLGHPWSRWRGFLPEALLDDLLRLEMPVFVGHGSQDSSVPVASVDLIEVEFIRHGKRNLTVRRYPDLDHQFRRGAGERPIDRMGAVAGELLAWVGA